MDRVRKTINEIIEDNNKKIAMLFPNVVKDGEVDIEALKEELGYVESNIKEKYEFAWVGKQAAKRLSQEDIQNKTLKLVEEYRPNDKDSKNIYIEGDNLDALKLLRQNYYESVKMIYIDPPYNTGSDFVYNDKFKMSREDSLTQEGILSSEGEYYTQNLRSGNRFHANWLNMIYPRLLIARDLLADDGVIFISIDDNELENLKNVCNIVFGEDNYVTMFPWRKRTAKSDVPFGISQDYEWIVCYAKTQNLKCSIEGKERRYYETEDFPDRPWRVHDLTKQTTASERPNSYFTITNPKTGVQYPANPNRTWAITQETFEKYYEEDRIVFPGDYNFLNISRPALRYWKQEDMEKAGDDFGKISVSTKLPDNIGMSQDGTKEILSLFEAKVFPFPKPSSLIKYLCKISTEKDDVILDFFSGSATTAQAVMQLNAEDEGTRRFILVQYPEKTDETKEAYIAGYKNICEIGKERIKRAGKTIANPDIDTGMKVFRVSDTNIKWNSLISMGQLDMTQIETTPDLVDFVPNSKDVDIVYELILRQRDVPLSEHIDKLSDIGERTYLYADAYMICLESEISTEMIDKMAAMNPVPVKYIFRDSAFKDDIALKDESIRRLKAVIEKNTNQAKQTYTVEFI